MSLCTNCTMTDTHSTPPPVDIDSVNSRVRPGAADYHFELEVPPDARRQLALAWFGLGLFALLASGLFSILLVLSRTPQLPQPLLDAALQSARAQGYDLTQLRYTTQLPATAGP